MKVVFCTLYLGDAPTEPFRRSLENCLPLIEANGWEHSLAYEANCPYISAARSKVLRKAMDAEPDAIVFLDYDVSWTPEAMLKLLETEGDVVAGTYRQKCYEPRYMGVLMRGESGGLLQREDGCLKAEKVPAGFLKVTPLAVNTFALKYPELLFGLPMKPELDMFNHGAIDKVWYGEDYAFSKRWLDIGGDIWLIPDLDIGHNKGETCYEGNLHKHLLEYNKPVPILSNPLVSIVITCYNYGRYLPEAIESALNQTYNNIEIIVVDDGSTDNTEDIVEFYPTVTYIHQANSGVASARNTGVAQARGEWIICLDADDTLHPRYVEECLRIDEADVISTSMKEFGDSNKVHDFLKHPAYWDFAYNNQIHCASMFRKECWEKVGGYDILIAGYEDWDFWIALAKEGYEFTVIKKPLFNYRKHGRSLVDEALERHEELYSVLCEKYNIKKR